MPTATGLPKAGERISLVVPGEWNDWSLETPREFGRVVERGRGDYWTLYVRWDKPHFSGGSTRGRDVDMLVDAAYYLSRGWLRIEEG